MIIEVTGIGFPNKGAELMLQAVVEAVRGRLGERVVLTCAPSPGSRDSFRSIVDHGMYLQAKYYIRRYEVGSFVADKLPRKMLRMFGCYSAKEVSVVLDASGLRYADKFGLPTARRALRQYRRVKQRGGRVVLLPQAFGPLTGAALRDTVRRICGCADLIFARDAESYRVLEDLTQGVPNVKLAPDLTHLVAPEAMAGTARWSEAICIIPNTKMVNSKEGFSREKYLASLNAVCRACLRRGRAVLVLNHEGPDDEALARSIVKSFSKENVEYYQPINAFEAKRVIGSVYGVITSRYHGLVSALSQGVPALTTSWSHKYEAFLRDYGVDGGVIEPQHNPEMWGSLVDDWLTVLELSRRKYSQQLLNRANAHKAATKLMWDEVFHDICSRDHIALLGPEGVRKTPSTLVPVTDPVSK